MESSNQVYKVFESEPSGGSHRKERPCLRWGKQVHGNVTTLGIRNWRQAATARDVWRRKLAEAKTCNNILGFPICRYFCYFYFKNFSFDNTWIIFIFCSVFMVAVDVFNFIAGYRLMQANSASFTFFFTCTVFFGMPKLKAFFALHRCWYVGINFVHHKPNCNFCRNIEFVE